MGKKDPKGLNKKSQQQKAEAEEDEASDAELEAEMQALAAIRAEREAANDSEEEEDDEDRQAPSIKAPIHRQRGTYNKEGMEIALASCTDLPFVESYEVCEFELDPTDENDDLARETAFYQHALQAVDVGRERLKQLGVPTRRPDDYFAENMKSDAHMGRVKDKLLLESKKMDAFEKRRQRETNRKYV